MAKNEEMFSMSYEDAKNKYGTGIGNNKMFMPKETFTKKQAELNKNKQTKQEEKPKKSSLVADKFGKKKEKTWNDVKAENGNDPEKIKDYLNNNPSYKAGNLTKKGMEEFGYAQGEDGKWSIKEQPTTNTTTEETQTTEPTTITTTPYTATEETTTVPTTPTTNTTTEDVNRDLENLKVENEDLVKELDKFTKDGKTDKDAAFASMNEYQQRMIENGSATIDKNGNFKFKPVGKGWETWATLLSAGITAVGLAMGIPIPPINFRKLTGKDAKDEQTRKEQQQYLDILADNYAKVEGMKADIKAGELALENQDALTAQEKHSQATGATKDVISAQTDASKQLIDKQTEADLKKAQQQLVNSEKILQLEQKHAREMTILSDKLSTASAKELTAYSKSGWLIDYIKEARAQGLTDKEIALAISGLNGQTPTQKGLENAKTIVGMVADVGGVGASFLGKK